MTRKNMWVAGVAAPVMIAMLLLFAGLPSVTANDQPHSGKHRNKNRQFQFWATDTHGTRRSDSYLDK